MAKDSKKMSVSELEAKIERLQNQLEHELSEAEDDQDEAKAELEGVREQHKEEVGKLKVLLNVKEAELEKTREQLRAALENTEEQRKADQEALAQKAEEALALAKEQHRLDVEALQHQLDEAHHQLLAGAGLQQDGFPDTDPLMNTQMEEHVERAEEAEQLVEHMRANYEVLEQECASLREQLEASYAAQATGEYPSQQDASVELQRQVEQQTERADTLEKRCKELTARATYLEQENANTIDLRRQLEQQIARADALDKRCEELTARAAPAEQEGSSTTGDLQRQVQQQTARADALEQRCEELRSRTASLEHECATLQAAALKTSKTIEADKLEDSSAAKDAELPLKQLKCGLEASASSGTSGHSKHESGVVKEVVEDASKTGRVGGFQERSQLTAEVFDKADSEWAKIVDEIQLSVNDLSTRLAQSAMEPESTDAESLRRMSDDFRKQIALSTQSWSQKTDEVRRRNAALRKELNDSNDSSLAAQATTETSEMKNLRAELTAEKNLKAQAEAEIKDLQEQVERLCNELKADRKANSSGGGSWFFCTGHS
eukprot:TRINITY_DN8599_c0_g1_i6.p1 TRINITY_DN8599_c0_g1~~TRINITY_DN8599_c0_g1_i6.p1  ORF type:complete len:550 (-),score=141.86 TRINITY_DN8599_c0_g1_i6:248-1897(-)